MRKEKVLELAYEGYMEALEDFHYPPISDPEIIYETSKPMGFWIDTEKWKVYLNAAETPSIVKKADEVRLFFKLMSRHEIGHYIISPVDTATSIKMILEAKKVLKVPSYGVLISNIVADIINDVKRAEIFGCDPVLLDALISVDLKKKKLSSMEKGSFEYASLAILLGVKQKLWNKRINAKECRDSLKDLEKHYGKKLVRGNKLNILNALGLELSEEISEDIEKIAKIIEKGGIDNINKMPQKTKQIAKILAKYIREEEEACSSDTLSRILKGHPDRVVVDPKDIEDEEFVIAIIEEISKESTTPKDAIDALKIIKEARGKTGGIGGGKLTNLDALRHWYRANSKRMAKILVKSPKPSGLIPSHPTTWSMSDPVEELDIQTTLGTLPVVIPNITTKKWVKTEVIGIKHEENVPDLLIVIDSSGSMGGIQSRDFVPTDTPYHLALLGAFAAIHLAWRRGAYLSIINFSDRPLICNWTRNIREAEDKLLKYQGGGTYFPAKKFKKVIEDHKKIRKDTPVVALIITDAEIYNWKETEETIIDILENQGTVALIYINTYGSESNLRRIKQRGAKIFRVRKPQDLTKIIIETTKEQYKT